MENWFTDTTPVPLAPPSEAALGDFEPLRRAERILLRACFAGDIAKVGFQRPSVPQPTVTIRGEFLAFLARGGSEAMPVKGRRIQIVGAWIEGRVDLGGADVPASLWLFRCVFDQPLLLDGARIAGGVALPDCRLRGLLAERCTIGGDLMLNAGCRIAGEVRIARAVVDGDLKLDRLRLVVDGDAAPARRSLVADFVRVAGETTLGRGFESTGEVRFVGAHFAGDFEAGAARLNGSLDAQGGRRAALNLDGATIDGDLRLGAGFAAAGGVRLRGARIAGDLDGSGAAFDVIGDAAWGTGSALVLERARIGGTLCLHRLRGPLLGVSLEGTRADALLDDDTTWGERIVLDGFRYRRLAAGAPTDAAFRRDWLERQQTEHLVDDFRPGPWRQIIRTLRRGGHLNSARDLAVWRERHLRRIGRIGRGLPGALRLPAHGLHALFGAVAGYGHRPARLVGLLAALWLGCALVYDLGHDHGLVQPTPSASAALTAFEPWVYSLDLLLPGMDLGQQRRFAPAEPAALLGCIDSPSAAPCLRAGVRALGWIETLLGWLGLATLVVSVLGASNRDRRG